MPDKVLADLRRRLEPPCEGEQGLSLSVRLLSGRRNDVGLVGDGLPRLLPRRGEAIGQATEIVIIVQVFRTGFSCSPHVALLSLELHGLCGGDQSEIVFGVLKIILRRDRIVARVSVARQLKVFFRHQLLRDYAGGAAALCYSQIR
jgi:hypothetical protein